MRCDPIKCLPKPFVFAAAIAAVSLCITGCPTPPSDTIEPGSGGVHWLRIAHISDTQIVDEESPNRAVRLAALMAEAWRPQEAYGLQTLDATLRVINEHHSAKGGDEPPVDFVIATGDLTDGCQHNELRWFIDTMDGHWVLPDSGEADGELRDVAPEDNPKLGFQAEGLDPSIPWYTVFGNHDELSVGTFAVDRTAIDEQDWKAPLLRLVATAFGLHLLDKNLNALEPVSLYSPAILRGSEELMDPDTLELLLGDLEAGRIVADPERHFSRRTEFIEEHFNTTTAPAGHGFDESNVESGLTRYSVHPKDGIPVRLVVMDTVAPNPPPGLPAHYGIMTREQFESFVKPEIEDAQAEGEFVILASHHPSEDFDLPYPQEQVRTPEWREYVSSQPNIIAHLCGHTHVNYVEYVDGAYPYYEIQTGSIIDYPQEGRILDIYYDESTDTIRLESTMLSHMENPTRLSEESYRRSAIHASNDKSAQPGPTLDTQLKDAARASGMAPVDMFPPQPPAEAAYGKQSDRDFVATFRRAMPRH
ncbi:MAG: metallophosphoesterase [Candidatus Hydrogenedentes bacterium]|nr:metallophosphoesterase [Candidatus Hydrogenedentota bacterium]